MENNSDLKKKPKLKEFGITTFAVNNSTSVFLLAVMIFIIGILSYIQMPKEQFPEASLPTVYINTPYFGNSASEIENLVTRPIEKELENISGIKNVNSTSIQDFSVIIAEFEANLEMESVVRKVKDAVDKAKPDLPTDLTEEPSVLEINFSDIPIVTVNVSGDYSNDDLKKYAEILQDRIEDINQVSKVDLKGALDREMRIDVDLLKMQSLKVSFSDIENAVSSENLTMSGGEIINKDFKRGLRIIGQFENADQIANLIVKSENQRPIVLKDIADVKYGYKDRTSYSRSDGFPVISLDVIKRKGQNLLEAADQIQKEIAYVKEIFPKNVKISVFNDQSVDTRREVNNLENSIISGIILVTLVLLFFLGLRNATFVGLAIPMSMILGFLILYVMGITLNIVVLFALVLALGMLVDNGIVAVENMYRYMQEGHSAFSAAKHGIGEIAVPIISSTATTLAAFIPLAFWPGIMGEFMKYFPFTLIIVLTSSLFVALVINPVIAKRFMHLEDLSSSQYRKIDHRKWVKSLVIILVIGGLMYMVGLTWAGNLAIIVAIMYVVNHFFLTPMANWFQREALPWLETFYDNFVRWSLGRPILLIFFNICLLIFSIVLLVVRQPKVEFFPNADPIYINAFVELPLGSDIEATNAIVKDIEAKIENKLKDKRHIVDAILTQIGENTSDPNSTPEPGVTPHKARLTIAFLPFDKRDGISTTEILNELRAEVKGYPGIQVVFDKNAQWPTCW
ncbi:MAG: efflux RND transporter permease subunit [Saprospiraceae bacterium]